MIPLLIPLNDAIILSNNLIVPLDYLTIDTTHLLLDHVVLKMDLMIPSIELGSNELIDELYQLQQVVNSSTIATIYDFNDRYQ